MLFCSVALQCAKPADIENGALVGLKESGSYHTNDVISVVCDSGYGVKVTSIFFCYTIKFVPDWSALLISYQISL